MYMCMFILGCRVPYDTNNFVIKKHAFRTMRNVEHNAHTEGLSKLNVHSLLLHYIISSIALRV